MNAEEAKLISDKMWQKEVKLYLESILASIEEAANRGHYSISIPAFEVARKKAFKFSKKSTQFELAHKPIPVDSEPRAGDLVDLLNELGYTTHMEETKNGQIKRTMLVIGWANKPEKSRGTNGN